MTLEVCKAELNVNFKQGFTISPELSIEEALKAVLQGLKNGDAQEVNIAVEYRQKETIE
ncbi:MULTISPECIES: hypothetical protein [unclassified Bacillus (in: firmicutes)]|jgi:uncharacterized protein (DUF2344 family)|uniref:hypothetical protein n=1 Tax=unclassified Bacillus (in: firmicutes) TaxID=185979 RepID=UPI000AA027D9|nr:MULTISPECIES: hypothetical protein [unclassified Bacillus (in: firmicutes)]NMH71891.1 hypothetical protein [Bacillus sp. RO2]